MQNMLLMTDSYKVSHWPQYPPGTTNVYSYFESRGGEFKEVVFFGLSYLLQKYLSKPITQDDIDEAVDFYTAHFGTSALFNKEGWQHILDAHDGYLPVKIKAVPEGTVVPTHNVMMTIENTDPECFWLTNWLETLLSQVWYPSTVATLSHATKKLILGYLEETGDPSLIDFKLHDFGFRGVSSVESAEIGGLAHLVNFKGTDTVAALWAARKYYDEPMAGFSVPASEHSTMTSWGKEHETDAYRNMIKTYGDQPLYSVVSDSYDVYNAAENIWGGTLRDEVLAAAGTLVVRPDSGYPPIVVSNLLKILGEKFDFTTNSKGYKVLNPKVRVIQGDGLDYAKIEQVLATIKNEGWSADNVVFGMGGGLLQKVNRDTQKFAFKCSSAVIDGVTRDVFKDPATDPGKVSKKGRLSLRMAPAGLQTVSELEEGDLLEVVFEDGVLSERPTLTEVRDRVDNRVPVLV